MQYKGYVIKDLAETPDSRYFYEATIARGYRFMFCKGDILDEGSSIAKTLDEAAEAIDELTANDPSPEDKLKIAVQCIEANKQEFVYRHKKSMKCELCSGSGSIHLDFRDQPQHCNDCSGTGENNSQLDVIADHMIQLCANALKAIES